MRRGEFKARAAPTPRRARVASPRRTDTVAEARPSLPLTLPEDLLDMDAEEFRRVLADVIRDELGVGEADIAGRWEGGEVILKPGKDGLRRSASRWSRSSTKW